MIGLFSLDKKRKTEGGTSSQANRQRKRPSPAQLRLQKDLGELILAKTCDTEFPDVNDLLNFKLIIRPEEGFYTGGRFVFSFHIGKNYPHEPPKVKCETKIYHPNIDLEGNVCLNILRQDWNPVLTISSVIYGLQHLLLEPNPEDPLNKEAANVLKANRSLFRHNVTRAMYGEFIGETSFHYCLK